MALLLSNEACVKRCIQVHSNKYDYSQTIYKDSRSQINIICMKHGEFFQYWTEHMAGGGCKKCAIDEQAIKRVQVARDTFVEKANVVHNNFYNYDKSNYTKAILKVIISCPIHGDFEQSPNSHLNGAGCYKCGRVIVEEARLGNVESFIARANQKHNSFYSYEKSVYTGYFSKIEITCPTHGSFFQEARKHLCGNGCRKCRNDGQMLTQDELIADFKRIHDDKYDYSEVIYKGIYDPVIIICKKHGKFKQRPVHHKIGRGCRKCVRSISHVERRWLDDQGVPDNELCRNVRLKINDRVFCVDGYSADTNTIYEFNGDYFHGNPKIYKSEDINRLTKETFGSLYLKTISKENYIKAAGYTIISIWESEYYEQCVSRKC